MAFDRQATDDALGYATGGLAGAVASARILGELRNSTVNAPTQDDVQLQGH
jgi:hypothetical protein